MSIHRVIVALGVGSLLCACAARDSETPATTELTLLTWNLLHGANEEGELNLEAKGEFIARQRADLVFLQEIDRVCTRSGGVDQMAVLGLITGTDPAFGAFMDFQGGEYGLGMLSALPVRSTRSLRLPEGDEPRVALLREVEVLGETLLAVDVHFNWTRDDTSRFAQVEALLGEIAKTELAVVVAGDFNDTPESRSLQAFYAAGFRHVDSPGPSWNAKAPSQDIDHILIRSGAKLRLEALDGEVMAQDLLSDHRPVIGRTRVTTLR